MTDADQTTSQDRPLVTFALFAYNQEKYIREAVEGAFSQTYEPLEIILSDDCSSDRTFEIMQEMAAGYKGPHRVVLRQSAKNMGLMRHIASATEAASGEFVVISAGDDVSKPTRTQIQVDLLRDKGALLGASNFDQIDDNGNIIAENVRNDYTSNYIWRLLDVPPLYFANGATAIYKTDFIRGALQSIQNTLTTDVIYNEDMIFCLYAVSLNEIPAHYTRSALVKYRIVPSSLSNFRENSATFTSSLRAVTREALRSKAKIGLLKAAIEMCERYPRLRSALILNQIHQDLRLASFEAQSNHPSLVRRVCNLARVKNWSEARISLARMGGANILAALKLMINSASKV